MSPAKWHLAHTTWFFESFVLSRQLAAYQVFHPQFGFLFNSYYESVGPFHPRPLRGLLSRPSWKDVLAYRAWVDRQMGELLMSLDSSAWETVATLVILGLNHEQQHQELLLMDLKHAFGCNPLRPQYRKEIVDRETVSVPSTFPLRWMEYPREAWEIGATEEGFAYDNERPRHRVFLEAFQLGSRLITNGEYLEFMHAGGYENPGYWLSDGWLAAKTQRWEAPLYWETRDEQWWTFTLSGMQPVKESEPLCHVSYFEADAFARWRGKRLPTEAEWERASSNVKIAGNFLETERLQPSPLFVEGSNDFANPSQMFGDVWEWTSSPYVAYPGFVRCRGDLGEYNGKFMCGQLVLRGGACVTPLSHIRSTYRNFYPPDSRWPFTGVRLAEDA